MVAPFLVIDALSPIRAAYAVRQLVGLEVVWEDRAKPVMARKGSPPNEPNMVLARQRHRQNMEERHDRILTTVPAEEPWRAEELIVGC